MELDFNARFSIEKLRASHVRKDFDCGVASLNVYLQKQASQDERRSISVTYVVNDVVENKAAGFYTLSSATIESVQLTEEVVRKLPGYPLLPATLVGRLAVDKMYQKKKLGEVLLMDSLHRSYESSKSVASFAVVVEAINKQAESFYKKYGFIDLEAEKKLYYLAMKTVRKLFC